MWAFNKDNEEKINKAFNEQYPSVTIEVIPVPWADYENKFQVALAAGADLPDIVIVESYWWGKWLKLKGVFDDLSQYGINQTDIFSAASDIIRNKQEEFIIVPVATGVGCIWYRKDLAKKYLNTSNSVDMEKILKTWDDFMKLGSMIKTASNNSEYLFPDTMSIEEFLIASDKNYMDGNTIHLKDKLLPRFKLIEDMLSKGYIAKAKGIGINQSILKGNVMFYPYADWKGEFIKDVDENGKGKWGVMKPPRSVFFRGGNGYAIPKKSKKENKLLAAKRVNFVLTKEGSKAVIDINQMSAYKNAYSDEVLKQKDDYFEENLILKFHTWFDASNKKLEYSEYDDVIEKELRRQAYNMMDTNISAEQALDNTQKELQYSLDENIVFAK